MRRWGHSGGAVGYGVPVVADPLTISSVWVGDVTSNSAVVKARSTDASSVTLRYSTASTLSGYATATGSEGADDVWSFDLTGLDPETRYYYDFIGDTSLTLGTFVSFPTAGAAYSFAVAAASCGGHSGGEYVTDDVSNAPTYEVIADKLTAGTIIGFLHFGDRHYRDINSSNVSLYRDAYQDVMAAPRQLLMHTQGWVDYVWDDHDYGPNDSGGSYAHKATAAQAYREHVPWTPVPESGPIYHTYVIGRVRFIQLDNRYERSANGATDDSSKTMLGATQKAWLLDVTDNATEPLIVIHTGSPWIGSGSISWGAFSTERDELIAHWDAEGTTAKLLMIHGDNHFLAGDDGTNAPGGIPTFCLSPLDAGFTSNDGTWSTGIIKSEQQQYGVLTFADDGEDITVTVRGYSVNSSGVETERFEVVLAY